MGGDEVFEPGQYGVGVRGDVYFVDRLMTPNHKLCSSLNDSLYFHLFLLAVYQPLPKPTLGEDLAGSGDGVGGLLQRDDGIDGGDDEGSRCGCENRGRGSRSLAVSSKFLAQRYLSS